jgi:hypothetical protein
MFNACHPVGRIFKHLINPLKANIGVGYIKDNANRPQL